MTKIISTSRLSKKEIICQKAAYTIRLKGYKACTMRNLATAIGVEAPSLYNHIGSKSEILQNICFGMAELYIHNINHLEAKNISVEKKIEGLIRFQIKLMLSHFDEVYIANTEWKQLPEPYLEQFLQKRKTYENQLMHWLKTGMHHKKFKKAHPYITAVTLLTAIRGLEHWYKYKDQVNLKIVENNIVQQLMGGIII